MQRTSLFRVRSTLSPHELAFEARRESPRNHVVPFFPSHFQKPRFSGTPGNSSH